MRRSHVPTGSTPGTPSIKTFKEDGQAKASPNPALQWSTLEDKDIITFIGVQYTFKGQEGWPMLKDPTFWKAAAQFLKSRLHSNRSENACRSRVRVLKQKFKTLANAENSLGVTYEDVDIDIHGQEVAFRPNSWSIKLIAGIIKQLDNTDMLRVMDDCFSYIADQSMLNVPKKFVSLALESMATLEGKNKSNIVYNMTKAIASNQMPLNRMPYPLLEANIQYFANNTIHIPIEYRAWLETMYSHFGEKFIALFCGPMFKWDESEENNLVSGDGSNNPVSGDGDNSLLSGDVGNNTVSGDGANDLVSGDGGNNAVTGDRANGLISGNGGNNLVSGDGANNLVSGDGAKNLVNGDGSNNLVSGDGAKNLVTGDGGNNAVSGDGANGLVISGDGANGLISGNGGNNLVSGDGANNLVSGDGAKNLVNGDGSNNLVSGDGANGLVISGNGSNNLVSGDGSNGLVSGDGAKNLVSGDGSNNLVSGDGAKNLVTGDGGNNAVSGYRANGLVISGDGSNNLVSGDGSNNLVSGDGANNLASGDGSNNLVSGDGAKNLVTGDGGNNTVSGDGSNNLVSGDGSNNLVSGDGANNLASGDGDGGNGKNNLESGDGCEERNGTPIRRSSLWRGKTTDEEKYLHDHGQTLANYSKEIQEMRDMRRQPQKSRKVTNPKNKALVNIIGLSSRQLRYHISKTKYNVGPGIQSNMLKQAKKSNPNARWWVKADACDIQKGIRESLKNEWSGDVDMGDGQLEIAHQKYVERLSQIDDMVAGGLHGELQDLRKDLPELENSLQDAKKVQNKKENQPGVTKSKVLEYVWDVHEWEQMIKTNKALQCSISKAIAQKQTSIQKIKNDLKEYTKQKTDKTRVAATHLMVFMISDEKRNMKPYALPVRAMPVTTIKDEKMRDLMNEVKQAMIDEGMTVAGFVTDGEWNTLRSSGSTRPVQLTQVIKEAKEEAKDVKFDALQAIFKPHLMASRTITEDGIPKRQLAFKARQSHPAVPLDAIGQIGVDMHVHHNTLEESLHKHHCKLYEHLDHEPDPWTPGTSKETCTECMRSILSTYILRRKIKLYQDQGINFHTRLYVPEYDASGDPFFHREDHGHLLKRITTCVRSGAVPDCDMTRWVEALTDEQWGEKTGLTLGILRGERKQSVPDCESMFNPMVSKYMEEHGYQNEARFIKLIYNWHKATDGRGITREERIQYNKDLLDYILDDWMPWHRTNKDYSLVDVNRPIKGICGFTREILIGLIANIESQLLRMDMCSQELQPEHPRAGTSDDVEAFIALLHHMLGPVFDLKKFWGALKKILNEFEKRISGLDAFYYYQGINERYHIGVLPSFDMPSDKDEERLDRTRKRRFGNPVSGITARKSRPVTGQQTIRSTHHKRPDPMPEVPS